MKVIIAGSRDIDNMGYVEEAIKESGFEITEVVCGLCRGVDLLGKEWALKNNVPIKEFPPNWNLYGNAAGPIRNKEMAEYAEALIAIRKAGSKGTTHMILVAKKKGLKFYVKEI